MAPDRLRRQMVDALERHLAGGPLRVPEAGRLVWGWFVALSGARGYGFAGPNPIGFAEIAAYAALTRQPMRPDHVELLRALDATWLQHQAGGSSAPAVGSARAPAQPVTPAVFDAVFG